MQRELILLFTDVVDSTRLTEELGDTAAAEVWKGHDRITRHLLRKWGGREIDKSDGFLLLFEDVGSAVACSIELHRELARLDPPLFSRAGIHSGRMLTRENSADDQAIGAKPLELDGIGKAVASRIMNLARGQQTLLSNEAKVRLGETAWRLQSHGHWRMKGLAEPIEVFEVGDQRTAFHPPPDSPKSYRVMRDGEGWMPAARLPHGLPAERDSFVGRGEALASLAATFDNGARLVSVLGIGGIGKTRLALRYARDWLGDYPGGAWFCDLSSARTVDGIAHAVAQSLDVPLGKASPTQLLGAAINGRGACLVIFDNFEQVARHGEETVGHWLERAPQARFLVTSREVLGISGEVAFVLAPMALDEAMRLFDRRAEATHAHHAPEPTERALLAQLIDLLDRLPLAIELAAARVRLMTVQTMLNRMGQRFKLLASRGGRRDRQSTLSTALDWSWDLLSPAEQSVLAQLSVFEGGFTLEAAEAVVELSNLPDAAWVGDHLQGLIEKSWLARSGTSRFSFLRTVLDYLLHKGVAENVAQAAHRRHASYFAHLDEHAATANRCADIDNLLLACRRTLPQDVPLAVCALVNLWTALRMTGPLRAIEPILHAIETSAGVGAREQMILEWVGAGVLHQTGDLAQALGRALKGVRLASGQADTKTQAAIELTAGDVQRSLGRLSESAEHFQRALALAEASGDSSMTLQVLNSLGTLHYTKGDHSEARLHYTRALDLARAAGQQRWTGGLLGNLALLSQAEGHLEDALVHFEEALALAERIGDRQWEGNNRSNMALLQHDLGNSDAAAVQLRKALRIAKEIGHGRLERIALCNLGIVLDTLKEHGEALECFEGAIALCIENADAHSESEFRGHLALHLARNGEHARADNEIERAIARMREMDDLSGLALVLSQGAMVAALTCRIEDAKSCAAESERVLLAPSVGNRAECGRLLREALAAISERAGR